MHARSARAVAATVKACAPAWLSCPAIPEGSGGARGWGPGDKAPRSRRTRWRRVGGQRHKGRRARPSRVARPMRPFTPEIASAVADRDKCGGLHSFTSYEVFSSSLSSSLSFSEPDACACSNWEQASLERFDFELRDLAFFARDSLGIDEDQLKNDRPAWSADCRWRLGKVASFGRCLLAALPSPSR